MRAAAGAALAAIGLALAIASVPAARADEDDEASLLIDDAKSALDHKQLDRAASLLDRALAADPRRIDAYVLRGSIHVAKKEFARAIALLERARGLAPRNLDVLQALGGAEVLGGKADAGLARLEAVIAAEPRRYQAHAVLGQAYLRRGEWDRAAHALQGYLDHRPKSLAGGDVRYQLDLANALLRGGKPRDAGERFDAIAGARPKNVEARLGRAWAAAAVDCRAALPQLRDLGELADSYPEILEVHARCALLIGDHGAAMAVAERYRGLRPERAEPHALLGEARAGKGDNKGALDELGKAVELAPGVPVFAFKLARVERAAGKPKDAADRLRVAGAPVGFEDEWTLELGLATYESGDPAGARTTLEPLVTRRPELAAAQGALGAALSDLGDLPGAIDHLRRGYDGGDNSPRTRGALIHALDRSAVAAFENSDLKAADSQLAQALEVGDDPAVRRNLAAVRLVAGDAAGALTAIDKPSDAVGQYLRARALAALGKWDDAIAAYRVAAKNPPDPTFTVDVAIDLAGALRRTGQLDDAVAAIERGLAAGDPALAPRVREAYFATAQAAATDALADGRYAAAAKLLEAARNRLDTTSSDGLRIAIDCDLALASSAAGRRDRALELLRPLAKKKAVCPYAAPADALAVDILIAWNEGVGNGAKGSLAKLDGLRGKATGTAANLLTLAARDVALHAAVDAYDRGKLDVTRQFLDGARRYDRQSEEIVHNLAALDIQLGHPERAVPVLENLGGRVPEALVNLGIALEATGHGKEALAAWQKARAAKVRGAQLDAWIAAKERLWGAP